MNDTKLLDSHLTEYILTSGTQKRIGLHESRCLITPLKTLMPM